MWSRKDENAVRSNTFSKKIRKKAAARLLG